MFWKKVMILFDAKKEKKQKKRIGHKQGKPLARQQRFNPSTQRFVGSSPHLRLLKKVAVELVITISLPDVGCLSICQFAGSRWNQGGRKVKNWTIGCPVPSSAVYYGSTEQGSFIYHIGEGSHGLRVCSHQAESIFVPVEKSICYSVDCRDPEWHEQAQGCSHDLFCSKADNYVHRLY